MTDIIPAMPSSVRVLGMDMAVVVRTGDDAHMDDKFGYCDNLRMRIVLSENNTPSQMRETCLHEVVHAVEWAVKADMEEDEVGRMARGLFAVLRDNPSFVKWIMEQ